MVIQNLWSFQSVTLSPTKCGSEATEYINVLNMAIINSTNKLHSYVIMLANIRLKLQLPFLSSK